jgi:hypothetical protein
MTVLVMVKNLLVIKTFYLIIKDCQRLVYNLPFCMSFFAHIQKLFHVRTWSSQRIFSVYLSSAR